MTIFQNLEKQECGCDGRDLSDLMSMDAALARIADTVRPVVETEPVALALAKGRILADVVRARGMVPPFDNAAMDGYAIRSDSLVGQGPWELPVVDRVAAGHTGSGALPRGAAAQIFTGAPVPHGANAVVMLEDTEATKTGIRLTRPVTPNTHIRAAGEDMLSGKIVVQAGCSLTPKDIATCAAAGHDTVMVRRAVRVALLVTGDELRLSGQARGAAGIWDVNTPMLGAAIASPATDLCYTLHAADAKDDLRDQVADLAKRVDLIVTTGGVSVGEEDHVKPVMADLAATNGFSGVAIKPGKPVSFARLETAYWLGLPGNPLSAFVTWQLFGAALIRSLTAQATTQSLRRHVILSRPLHHKAGRCEMRLARISGNDDLGRQIADFADATHSGRVSELPDMDGMLFIPADTERLPEGALVEFQSF